MTKVLSKIVGEHVGEQFIGNNGISLMYSNECCYCNKKSLKPMPRYVLVSGVKDRESGEKIVNMFGPRVGVKLIEGCNGLNVIITVCFNQLNKLLALCKLTSDGFITEEKVLKFLSQ